MKKMDYKDYFKNKRIIVMGLGLLGRGVGDVKFLAECEAKLTVTDLKSEEELKPSLEQLKTYDISYVLGRHRLEDFRDCDMVIKAAGVPLDSPFIEEARKNKIPVRMSTALFAELSPATIIGVTGTRGKSTVAAMIFEILKKAHKKAFLGGNIRGLSTLAHLPESSAQEIAVLELDSWQLQGFGEAKISPHVSIFVTFMTDHLNYYDGHLDQYFADKANIFLYQKEENFLVLGDQVVPAFKRYGYGKKVKAHTVVTGEKKLSKQWKLKVPGEHNRYNASLAFSSADILGIDTNVISRALSSFYAVPGRLQFVREKYGIFLYNDNNATTPDATIAALKALDNGKKNIVLIAGGSDKSLDLVSLSEEIIKRCKALVLIPGTGTDKIKLKIKSLKLKVVEVSNLKEALEEAFKIAEKGDTILFSPAFASFGPPPGGFKNEYDRNDQFNALIKRL